MGDKVFRKIFYASQEKVRDIIPDWQGKGNPKLWFSWEELENNRKEYLANGVKTLREAQDCIEKVLK